MGLEAVAAGDLGQDEAPPVGLVGLGDPAGRRVDASAGSSNSSAMSPGVTGSMATITTASMAWRSSSSVTGVAQPL